MMRSFLLSLVLFYAACAHQDKKLCDNITLKEGDLKLSRNEKVVVCGSDKGSEGWRTIPVPQAQYQISVLLQRDGYLNPRFERDKDQLKVWSGPRDQIQSLEIHNGSGEIDVGKKRKIIGAPLVPEKLDEVQQWADTDLRMQGYACPKVEVTAQGWDKKVIANISPGTQKTIDNIEHENFENLDEAALKRYQAFERGQTYDVVKTQLTSSRLLADGIFQSAYYTVKCRDQFADLYLNGTIGPAKVFRFELGASTEEFPFANFIFKNSRLDRKASSFTAAIHASPRIQSVNLSSDLYWVPGSAQTFFGPRAQLARFSEKAYEYLEAKVGADLGRYWDMWHSRFRGRLGPTLNAVRTARGVGPDEVAYLSWEGNLYAMSHSYETNVRTQYEGYEAQFSYRGQRDGLGSKVSVDRFELDYKKLWNIGSFIPPVFVLGARLEAIGVKADQVFNGTEDDVLPIEYRIFYGGNDNLRGFSRKSLNNSQLGYLASVYTGFELRLIEELPWKLEPFLLFDAARLGVREFALDDPLFTSTGVGLRWPSPFGTLRGSAAKGNISKPDATTVGYAEEWVYFLSFGQEF
ncbi:MAG: BamA/TamA family outer membrane protein [Bdellovibrionales bacterium]|nr:BamA/TamA family outer membrane protein [Bdellovibrionales bacterium]